MKDAHQMLVDYGIKSIADNISAFKVERLIEQAQKDAYNQAVNDIASRTIESRLLREYIISKTLILTFIK